MIQGTLAVRLREATEEDTHFMNSFQAGYDPRNFLYPSHIPPTFTPKPSEFLSKHKKGQVLYRGHIGLIYLILNQSNFDL